MHRLPLQVNFVAHKGKGRTLRKKVFLQTFWKSALARCCCLFFSQFCVKNWKWCQKLTNEISVLKCTKEWAAAPDGIRWTWTTSSPIEIASLISDSLLWARCAGSEEKTNFHRLRCWCWRPVCWEFSLPKQSFLMMKRREKFATTTQFLKKYLDITRENLQISFLKSNFAHYDIL